MLAALHNGTSCSGGVDLLLWIIAVIVGIWGIVTLIRGAFILGIVLIILAFLIGPGGVSLIC